MFVQNFSNTFILCIFILPPSLSPRLSLHPFHSSDSKTQLPLNIRANRNWKFIRQHGSILLSMCLSHCCMQHQTNSMRSEMCMCLCTFILHSLCKTLKSENCAKRADVTLQHSQRWQQQINIIQIEIKHGIRLLMSTYVLLVYVCVRTFLRKTGRHLT